VKGVIMRVPRRGALPLSVHLSAARLGVIGLTAVLSGCSASREVSYVNGPSAQIRPQQVAAVPAKEDLEDDGKPAQIPPLRRSLPEEDDPTQPWSPNYGGPARTPDQPSGYAPKPTPKPRTKIYDAANEQPAPVKVRMSRAEEDSVIARAISAHEMRNQ
jgi:hypothetical protein